MIIVNYKYKDKKGTIKCDLEEQIRDVVGNIATLIKIDIDTIVVILNEEKINMKSKKTFEDIVYSYNLNKNEVEMLFFDDPEKIVKVIIEYQGDTKEIKAKKEKDTLSDIFDKLKLNMQEIFLIGGGEAIQQEDLAKSFKDLKKIGNEEGVVNFLAYKKDYDEEEKNDDIKDINDNEANNNNTNNNSNSNNNLNDNNLNENTNEKILNEKNSNEKILDENSHDDKILNSNNPEEIKLKDNNEKNKNDQKIVRYVSVANNKHFLTKTFLTLKIEFFLIMALTWLGCYLHINEAFIKTKRRMLWTFIPTIFVIFCISIILIDNCLGKERSGKEKKKYMVFYI